MSRPLVTHYLWFWPSRVKYIIACGKKDVHDELLVTVFRSLVTCTRCKQTQRFKGEPS